MYIATFWNPRFQQKSNSRTSWISLMYNVMGFPVIDLIVPWIKIIIYYGLYDMRSICLVFVYIIHVIRLMEEIWLTSWYGKYPIIYKVFATSQVVAWDLWTINSTMDPSKHMATPVKTNMDTQNDGLENCPPKL